MPRSRDHIRYVEKTAHEDVVSLHVSVMRLPMPK